MNSFLPTRSPTDVVTFVSYIFPPIFGYFIIAWLAVTPRTHALRVALWPVVTLLAWRASGSVDMSLTDSDQRFGNTLFIFSMIFIITRTLEWTLSKRPLMRRPPSSEESRSTIMNAMDLALTLRGLEWEWSRGVYVPRETRPMNRQEFTPHVIRSAVTHALICGVLHKAIRSFSPTGIGATGGSIYDDTLPFYLCHLRASIISLTAWAGIYTFIQTCYELCTLVAVLILGHPPERWPPAFDAPWRATSISDFWSHRWHQFFRHMFLVQGGYPLRFFFGRVGFVVGTFSSSAVLHHLAMVILNDTLEAWRLCVGFGMFAPVVLAENAFKQVTGRKVEGFVGRVWALGWFLLLGNLISDGFARAGMFGRLGFTEWVVPRKDIVACLVERFDAWLHAM